MIFQPFDAAAIAAMASDRAKMGGRSVCSVASNGAA
jgi:hypothetical protein